MFQQKQQFKAISLELLVDIFKSVCGYPDIIIKEEVEVIKEGMNISKIKQKCLVFRIKFVKNILISSTIINIFCREVLHKKVGIFGILLFLYQKFVKYGNKKIQV